LGIADPSSRGKLSPGDAVEELAIDLFAERRACNDGELA
jgi:hypothetical protein